MKSTEALQKLEAIVEAMEKAADEVVRESRGAQAEAAQALVQSYRDESAELMRLLDDQDRQDQEDARAEELEKAGKMPQ